MKAENMQQMGNICPYSWDWSYANCTNYSCSMSSEMSTQAPRYAMRYRKSFIVRCLPHPPRSQSASRGSDLPICSLQPQSLNLPPRSSQVRCQNSN
jgi:hypothetical protein